ncbi:MAG: hypothetical protein EOO52_13030 [Gammaproteobacteria bacterium]|nr:MAG: hypothetical protein EOO52_13030 [Gammaproteobacteria bacterium]
MKKFIIGWLVLLYICTVKFGDCVPIAWIVFATTFFYAAFILIINAWAKSEDVLVQGWQQYYAPRPKKLILIDSGLNINDLDRRKYESFTLKQRF